MLVGRERLAASRATYQGAQSHTRVIKIISECRWRARGVFAFAREDVRWASRSARSWQALIPTVIGQPIVPSRVMEVVPRALKTLRLLSACRQVTTLAVFCMFDLGICLSLETMRECATPARLLASHLRFGGVRFPTGFAHQVLFASRRVECCRITVGSFVQVPCFLMSIS